MLSEQLWRVELFADLNAREIKGYCWSALSDALDVSLIVPGSIVVAGDSDAAALVEIIDLQDLGHDALVRFRILPGLIEDYQAVFERGRDTP
jgi:hypothetical protein